MTIPNARRFRAHVDLGDRHAWLLNRLSRPGGGFTAIGEKSNQSLVIRAAVELLAAKLLRPDVMDQAPKDEGRTLGRRRPPRPRSPA
jgi:hypothetical protein